MRKKRKYILRRIIVIFAICIFLMGFLIMPVENAADQITSSNVNEINTLRYPGIKEAIASLKASHPNWNFKILYTGLDWYEVIQNEYAGHFATPTNLIPANSSTYNNNWICSICGTKTYDTGDWHCASDSAIKYMMDPRNFLDESNIFQFLELTYTSYNYEQIVNMVSGSYLNKTSVIDAIIDSAKTYDVNPYYIIARLIQEQGKSGTELVNGNGYNGSYARYYNAFNIGATGNTRAEVILSGLKRAQKEGWTSLEASIIGGTKIIAKNYIARGQNTLYLQKFDVENSDGTLYTHQYMQNLLAAKNEAAQITKVVKNLGIDNSYTFLIPVFENMPPFTETEPNLKYTESDDLVSVNVTGTLRMRNAPSGSQTIGWLNGGDIVTRVEMAQSKVNGTYWDKIKSSSGIYGYVARETYENAQEYKLYLMPVEENQPEVPNPDESTPDTEPEIPSPDDNIPDTEIGTPNPDETLPEGGGNTPEKPEDSENDGENNEEVIVKIGDVNNDGKISPTDYVLIKNHIMHVKLLQTDIEKKAADVNKDGKISPTDYVLIKNHIMHGTEI